MAVIAVMHHKPGCAVSGLCSLLLQPAVLLLLLLVQAVKRD